MMVDKCGQCDVCIADMIEHPTNGAVATLNMHHVSEIRPEDWQRVYRDLVYTRLQLQKEARREGT
jgi:hypothetical protein